jgi:hypothetical protein
MSSSNEVFSTLAQCERNLAPSVVVEYDATPPYLKSMTLEQRPTLQMPSFLVHLQFSEPVAWTVGNSARTPLTAIDARLLNMTTAGARSQHGSAHSANYFAWFASFAGALAEIQVALDGYQDKSGLVGTKSGLLQVQVPGDALWQQASKASAGATILTAAATSASTAAAASAVSGGGSTSLIRSVGHTQFLAMSVSLAVPAMPENYLQLCRGLE